MVELERKIYGIPIIGAFAFLNKVRESEPFFVYDKKHIHEFLYEKWKHKRDLFKDFFVPELDAPYPYFRDFDECIHYNAETINLNERGNKIKKVCLNDCNRILKEIRLDSLKYVLQIGIELDYKFGCDERGNRDCRIKMKRLTKSNLPTFYSNSLFKKFTSSIE